jgi:DUF4097 and DUF4098 domain-containing protein YvlB
MKIQAALFAAVLLAPNIFSQPLEDRSVEHRTYSGIHDLILDNISGGIEVTAGSSNSVEIEVEKILSARTSDRLALAKKEVSVSETREGGLLRITLDGPFRNHGSEAYRVTCHFRVKVPRDINLDLRNVNAGDIRVEGTSGEFHVSNINGGVDMREVAGSGSVSTVNGPVKVLFAQNPGAATSFKSVNGALDVSFRPGLNADVTTRTMHGGMFTDFQASAMPVPVSRSNTRDGRFVYRVSDRAAGVRIGSGGPELTFETVNGEVLIRNREK